MSLPVVLFLLAALLVVVSLVQRVAVRIALPASVLFALMGVGIGATATVILRSGATGTFGEVARAFLGIPVTAETFLYVFVPALLFQSALTIEVKRIIEDAAPIFLLAVVAVLVATAVIGVSLWPLAGLPLVACLLLASIVATTDAVAVIGIFRDVGAPARLCRLVEGESLLNDAAAIVAFDVLLGFLIGDHPAGVATAGAEFVWTFVGGLALGYFGARFIVALLPWLQDFRLAQVTLTVALPYLVFIIGQQALHVSGVVGAVAAGLVMSALAQTRIAPSDWQFLLDMWEQLAYWASSLIFVLAAILVPRLLVDVGWYDVLLLLVLIAAAFAARGLVLWGFLPALSAVGLSQRIGHRFKIVVLWGGLRGAVTLALALAVTENDAISHAVQRFVAVQATGFVLFTLLVQGLTLRPLIRHLGLDRLSVFDQALRARVLALSRSRVAQRVKAIGNQYKFSDTLIAGIADSYQKPVEAPVSRAEPPPAALADASDEELLQLGLVALTQRERAIVLEQFDARTISGRTVEELVNDVGYLLDRVRTRGPEEYQRTARQIIGFSRAFRAVHLLHRRFHLDGPLVDRLADRFERLLVSRIVLEELSPYIDETLAPLVNDRVTPGLHELLSQRRAMTGAAFEALGAQYPAYVAVLEQRFLRRVALRREAVEYRGLFDERVIGPELYGVLQRDVTSARALVDLRPRLESGLETRSLIARVPMFAELDTKQLDALARLLKPQFAVPDERLIVEGEAGDAMYFLVSGGLEVLAARQHITLTPGDFVGEMALVLNQPRQADVTARSYCQLLVLQRKDFQGLLKSSASIRARIDRAVADRVRMNEEAL